MKLISYLPCRAPTNLEMSSNYGVIELTPNVSKWDPHNDDFNVQEEAMTDFDGNVKEIRPRNFIISAVMTRSCDPSLFANDVIDHYDVSGVRSLDGKSSLQPGDCKIKWTHLYVNVSIFFCKNA